MLLEMPIIRTYKQFLTLQFAHPVLTRNFNKNQTYPKRFLASSHSNGMLHRYYSVKTSRTPEHLLVESYGDPAKVVVKKEFQLPENIRENEVLVRTLAAPINPADINTIQGTYAVKPSFPFVAGNEGVLQVMEIGSSVTRFNVGDKVIPFENALGTFSTHLVCPQNKFFKAPNDLDMIMLANIAANPCSAYRMLKDFVNLKSGDVVIQNCANSAVGRAVIQIAKSFELLTINVIRNRPNVEELKEDLIKAGATLVLTEEELRKSPEVKKFPKPKLALNGVSGKQTTDILRLLNEGGTMVTYGGMSRQPLVVPVGPFIFNDTILRSFWMTAWNKRNEESQERKDMLEQLFKLANEKRLTPPPCELFPLEDFKSALELSMPTGGMKGSKPVLIF